MPNQALLEHLEERITLIQRIICNLYERRDTIRTESKDSEEELAQLKAKRKDHA